MTTLGTFQTLTLKQRGIKRGAPLEVRFWSWVAKGEPDECWLWLGPTGRSGYAYFRSTGRARRAHRISWELTNGPIPAGSGYHGTCVCHRCDVRHCMNPAHLFLGSNAENMADMVAKNRVRHGVGSPFAKLTDELVREIRDRHAKGDGSHRSLAAEYGVSKSVVTRLINKRKWARVLHSGPA